MEQKLIFRQEVLQKAFEISKLRSDRPGTSHYFTSSDLQHTNSVTLYPVVQYPQTQPGQSNIQQSYLIEEPSSNIEQSYLVEERPSLSQQIYIQANDSSNQNSVRNDFLTFNNKMYFFFINVAKQFEYFIIVISTYLKVTANLSIGGTSSKHIGMFQSIM